MKLKRLIIKKLHGFLDKDIKFRNDLNILVGINGSGKTSILNVIEWLTMPDIGNLCTTEFSEIKLYFIYKKKHGRIICNQTEYNVKINVYYDDITHPLIIELFAPISTLNSRPELKESYFNRYSALRPDDKEIKAWSFLEELPNPIIVGLDRYLSISRLEQHKSLRHSSPIDNVKDFANQSLSKVSKKILDLNKDLRTKIMMSTFVSYDHNQNFDLTLPKIEQVNQLERNINIFLKNEENKELSNAVEKYFSRLKGIVKGNSDNLITTLTALQFSKVKSLFNSFEKYYEEASLISRPLEVFLETVNNFFRDSSKILKFKKGTNELYFDVLDKYKKVVKTDVDINNLSSGEQQLLILFTYISLGDNDETVFIIDEPEVSLHPKWQDHFLDSLIKVMPLNIQLVIASHSPSIVGKKKKYCTILLPYNDSKKR